MKIKITLAFLLGTFLTSLSQNNFIGNNLPSDVMMVVNFNLKKIHSSVDLDRIKNLDLIEFAYSMGKKNAGEDSTIIKRFYKDPNYYGINLESSVSFGFRQIEDEYGNKDLKVVTVLDLSKAKKFEKLLKIIFDEGTEYQDFLEAEGSFKIYKSKSLAYIWNKTNLYLVPIDYSNRETIDEELENIVKLTTATSLATNKSFLNSNILKDDIHFWMDYDKFLLMQQEEMEKIESKKRLFNMDLERIKGTEADFGLNFKDGQIVIDAISKVNTILKNENGKIYSKKVNPEFFNYIEADSLIGFYSMALDINEMKSSLESNYKNLLDTLEQTVQRAIIETSLDSNKTIVALRKQLDTDTIEWSESVKLNDSIATITTELTNLAMENINTTVDSTFDAFDMTRQDAWNLFAGDFLIASTGVYQVIDTIKTIEFGENEDGEAVYQDVEKTVKSPRPLFLTMATINLVDKCQNALSKLESEGIIKKQDDYFYVSVTKYDFFIKLNGDVLIFTNDKNIVTKNHKQGENMFGTVVNTEIVSKSTSSPIYIHVDLDKIIKNVAKEGSTPEMYLNPVMETFDTFEVFSSLLANNDLNSASQLNFKKKDDNAVHIIFDLANEYYKLFTQKH